MPRQRSSGDAKYAAVGRRLQIAREKAHMTQSDLAARLAVTTQAVSQAEVGKNLPSWPHMLELCRLSGCELQWIMTGQPDADGGAIKASSGGYDVPMIEIHEAKNLSDAIANATQTHRAAFASGEMAFALLVNDRSNEPQLMLGDTVVFDPDAKKEPGKFVLALVGPDLEPVIRMLQEREEGYVLVPANAAWAPKVLRSESDGEIVAVMVEFTRRA